MLCPGPESARVAREFTAQTLLGWHLDAIVDEAMIIASELVTNAIRHGMAIDSSAPGQVELSWQCQGDRVVCTVTDGSPRPPVLESADVTADSGRGLQIVQALAAAWGWMMLSSAQKAVWAAMEFVARSLQIRCQIRVRGAPGLPRTSPPCRSGRVGPCWNARTCPTLPRRSAALAPGGR